MCACVYDFVFGSVNAIYPSFKELLIFVCSVDGPKIYKLGICQQTSYHLQSMFVD